MNLKELTLTLVLKILFTPYLIAQNISEEYQEKYEYKYSFKGPYIAVSNNVPFWNHFYDSVPGEAQVRVVPSLRAMHGSVWTKNSFPHNEWQIEVSLRITGKPMMGADGLAIWYTEIPFQAGPVFGSMDKWKGMGILFDSFDNNNKRDNPYISIFINNGSISYDHATDGFYQVKHGCEKDFRNRPYPVKAKIIYTNGVLELFIHNGNSLHDFYELCARMSNVVLPPNYYFGVSAATGGLADDHDVLKFLTWSLRKKTPQDIAKEAAKAKLDEQQKQEEYQKSLEDFREEHKRFKEQYPDKVKEEHASPEDLFQGRTSEEAKSVFQVQSEIQHHINGLNQLINIAIQKQDAMLTSMEAKRPSQGDVARYHEAENSLVLEKSTFQNVIRLQAELEALKSTVMSITHRVVNMGAGTAASAPSGVGSMEASKKFDENLQRMLNIKEYLDLIDVEFKVVETREKQAAAGSAAACPEIPIPSCAPMSVFIGVAVAEVVILVLYFACRQPSIDPGKKYF